MLTRMPSLRDIDDLPPLLERVVPAGWEDLNGHVNVRHYLELYDQAGWPMMGLLGVEERHFRDERRGFFDLEHHIWYLAEMHVGETVSVHARFLARNAKRFHGVMFIANRSRACVASAFEYVSTGADLATRRSAPLPSDVAAHLDELIASHSRLAWPAPLCGSIST